MSSSLLLATLPAILTRRCCVWDCFCPNHLLQTLLAGDVHWDLLGRSVRVIGSLHTSTHVGCQSPVPCQLARQLAVPESQVLSRPLNVRCRQNDPVYAIILSGGYKDDADGQKEIIYTGMGGQKGGIQVSIPSVMPLWASTAHAE